ncbi:hypothetical protein EVAR_78972_1 [Eumeta japonica]|uniref:Uncharacterized protein n=1 Tax=Eumeta variegata TaxID=151549 RepID=A0A4C1US46_EUMVA|nr:hypothetical protein EVAR_78972_1 [Eumeta japonica]
MRFWGLYNNREAILRAYRLCGWPTSRSQRVAGLRLLCNKDWIIGSVLEIRLFIEETNFSERGVFRFPSFRTMKQKYVLHLLNQYLDGTVPQQPISLAEVCFQIDEDSVFFIREKVFWIGTERKRQRIARALTNVCLALLTTAANPERDLVLLCFGIDPEKLREISRDRDLAGSGLHSLLVTCHIAE